jgi:soluble lytic murein transglycosylase-like protein
MKGKRTIIMRLSILSHLSFRRDASAKNKATGFCDFRRYFLRLSRRGWFGAALLLSLLHPALLIGDDQTEGSKAFQLAKVRSALELQEVQMKEDSVADLAQSVARESERHSLDPLLVLAVIEVESRFDHKAVSPRGAQGLMQVQPAVVTALAEEGKIPPQAKNRKLNLKDPAVNVQVGASYLAYLKEMFGDLKVALTAYNSGPTWVSKKIAAKQPLPLGYATKVLSVQRSLENRLVRLEANRPEFSATSMQESG